MSNVNKSIDINLQFGNRTKPIETEREKRKKKGRERERERELEGN